MKEGRKYGKLLQAIPGKGHDKLKMLVISCRSLSRRKEETRKNKRKTTDERVKMLVNSCRTNLETQNISFRCALKTESAAKINPNVAPQP